MTDYYIDGSNGGGGGGGAGADGAQGSPGVTGPAGPQGATGAVGPIGPTGPVGGGPTGSIGPQGPTGQRGATGTQGLQGIQGVTGPAGGGSTAGGSSGSIQINAGGVLGPAGFVAAGTGFIAIGSGASNAGTVRLANGSNITFRDSTNTLDKTVVESTAADGLWIGIDSTASVNKTVTSIWTYAKTSMFYGIGGSAKLTLNSSAATFDTPIVANQTLTANKQVFAFDTTVPGAPVGGIAIYSQTGTLKWMNPTGTVYDLSAAGSVGPTGTIGPQGVAGPTGTIGPQGVAGPTGTAGTPGAAGPTGTIGATGPAGTAGGGFVVGSGIASGANGYKVIQIAGYTMGGVTGGVLDMNVQQVNNISMSRVVPKDAVAELRTIGTSWTNAYTFSLDDAVAGATGTFQSVKANVVANSTPNGFFGGQWDVSGNYLRYRSVSMSVPTGSLPLITGPGAPDPSTPLWGVTMMASGPTGVIQVRGHSGVQWGLQIQRLRSAG